MLFSRTPQSTDEAPDEQLTAAIAPARGPVVLMISGCVIAGAASMAPAAWSGLGPFPYALGGLAGLALIAVGGRKLYRLTRDLAEESLGHERGLKKARASNHRAANWIRRLHESTDFYWETDGYARITCLDGDGAKTAGVFSGIALGSALYDWPTSNMDKLAWDGVRKQIRDSETIHDLELQLQTEQGKEAWFSLYGQPTFGAGRALTGYNGVGRDITKQKVAERQVKNAEITDRLTSLPNRQMLLARLPSALAGARRRGSHIAVVVIDIDQFADINSQYGLLVGDQVLQQFASRLKASVRESDLVARMGGVAFAVILEDVGTNPESAQANTETVAQKLIVQLERPYTVSGPGVGTVTCVVRIGMAVSQAGGDGAESILSRARIDIAERATTS